MGTMARKQASAYETIASRNLNPTWTESAFADDVWIARGRDGVQRKCDFTSLHVEYRLTCKYLLWALEYETDSDISKVPVTAIAGYFNYFYQFRRLTNYLYSRGLTRLTSVTRENCAAFIKDRLSLRDGSKRSMSDTAVRAVSSLFNRLYVFGPAMLGKIPDGLSFDFNQTMVLRIIGTTIDSEQTPILPDHVARSLFNHAIAFLDHADALCLLIATERSFVKSKSAMLSRQYSGFLHRARERYVVQNNLTADIQTALSSLQSVARLSMPERQQYGQDHRGSIFGEELSLMMWTRLMKLLQHLLAACFIVIAIPTGFRAGEILSLERGWLHSSGFRTRLRTRVTKPCQRREGVEVDRIVPSVVQRAYDVLIKIAEARGRSEARLWASPLSGYVNGMKLSPMLQEFACSVAGEREWPITSRQFRRHFAVFFIRRFQGPEDALRHEFLHTDTRTLESYISNKTNAQHLVEAERELAYDIYLDRFQDGDAYRSRFRLDAVERLLSYSATNAPLKQIEIELQKMVSSSFHDVRPTFWGYCLLQRQDQAGARCSGKNGVPDLAEMHPGNCSQCKFLVTGREHIPFWQRALDEHVAAINHEAYLPITRAASTRFIEAARTIIESHETATS